MSELVSQLIDERLDRVEKISERPKTPRKYRDVWKFPKTEKPRPNPLRKKNARQEKFVEEFHQNRKPGPLEL